MLFESQDRLLLIGRLAQFITQYVHAVYYADLKVAGHFAERDFIVPKDTLPKEWYYSFAIDFKRAFYDNN
jgi:hypothetical protein